VPALGKTVVGQPSLQANAAMELKVASAQLAQESSIYDT
jgi:hypothetical protein